MPHKHPRSLSHPLYHCLRIALTMDTFHHILSCSLVTWQPVISFSLTRQPVTFPSRLLANFPSDTFPPVSLTSIALTIVSSPRFLRYCLPHAPLLRSICLPSHLFPSRLLSSCLPTSRVLTSCLPTTCHLTSSQPPPRLR